MDEQKEFEAMAQMDAPDMCGFDPDALYPWTPRKGREVTDEGQYDDEKAEWVKLPTYGKARPESPVLLFKALGQKTADRLETARQRYTVTKHRAFLDVAKGGDSVAAGETVMKAADTCYTSDLINDVIRESLAGWRNVRGAGREISFSGDWERDEVVIRRWKAEAFNAIVEETLFLSVADSFTSARDLPPG